MDDDDIMNGGGAAAEDVTTRVRRELMNLDYQSMYTAETSKVIKRGTDINMLDRKFRNIRLRYGRHYLQKEEEEG